MAAASWRIVSSSVIRAVAYDDASRELRVRFSNGSVYRYLGVPADVAAALVDPPSGSSGRYFNDHVRDAFDFDEE
ncbi:KTSC domain-containing protein [Schumannella luteola]